MSDYEPLHIYIDGKFLAGEGRETIPVTNPATGEVLGQLPSATRQDLDLALAAADKAFKEWRHVSPIERSRILRKFSEMARDQAERIGRQITLDQGKPLHEAVVEINAASEHPEWHAEEGRRVYGRVVPPRDPNVRTLVVREPVGVCAAFTPWNFPFSQAIRKVSAALAAGCTIILKGPEDAPAGVMAIARLFHDAGLPPGCLNLVWGDPKEISAYLISAEQVRKISFTGSVEVGKQLASLAGLQMKPCTLELGGHAPVIVLDDADPENAAKMLCGFKFRNAGQVCVSPTRFFIQDGIYDRFEEAFLSNVEKIVLGNGLESGTTMGPLAHERRPDQMDQFVSDAKARGARMLTGGNRVGNGNFFEPTVIGDVPADSLVMNREPFGPLAALVRFDDAHEALRRSNELPYGLAGYLFTESSSQAHALSSGLEVGMVNVNHFDMGFGELPFGGIKDSGYGREGGTETFDGYLTTKMITQKHRPLP